MTFVQDSTYTVDGPLLLEGKVNFNVTIAITMIAVVIVT